MQNCMSETAKTSHGCFIILFQLCGNYNKWQMDINANSSKHKGRDKDGGVLVPGGTFGGAAL